MKSALTVTLVLTALSAVDARVATATEIPTITGDLALERSLVRCTAPDDCSVTTINDMATGPTLGVITHDLPFALLATIEASFDIVGDEVAVLVGTTVGSGMVPSQSVMMASVLRADTTISLVGFANPTVNYLTACNDVLWSGDRKLEPASLSVTVSSRILNFLYGNGACTANRVAAIDHFSSTTSTHSLSVGRFGHRVAFFTIVNSILPVTEFPIVGRAPIDLGIPSIGSNPYPWKSATVTP